MHQIMPSDKSATLANGEAVFIESPVPVPGDYWLVKRRIDMGYEEPALEPGCHVLVVDVHIVHGDDPHSVVVLPPPGFVADRIQKYGRTVENSRFTFTIDDFLTCCVPAREDVGDTRQKDMESAMLEFQQFSTETSAQIAALVQDASASSVRLEDMSRDPHNAPAKALALRDKQTEIQQSIESLSNAIEPRAAAVQSIVRATAIELAAKAEAAMPVPKRMLQGMQRMVDRYRPTWARTPP